MKQTFQINGMRAPFQGFAPTLIRNVPANSIYLGLFEVRLWHSSRAFVWKGLYLAFTTSYSAWTINSMIRS